MVAYTSMNSELDRCSRSKESEVDFDENNTDLYEAITNCAWDAALEALERSPTEARTWVVRYHEGTKDVMWRFLPLHSACARKPPTAVVSALIIAYPEAAKSVDDQGMHPLHYACGNQASREVIRLLLVANPQAAKQTDPREMLPIHHLASWGPSSISVIDMVLVANRNVKEVTDVDGNTPLDLAKEADHDEKNEVIQALERWFDTKNFDGESTPIPSPTESIKKNTSQNVAESPSVLTIDSSRSISDDISYTRGSDVMTISRLREELSKLRSNQRKREQEWEEKYDQTVAETESKCNNLEKTLGSTTTSLKEATDKVQLLESMIESKDADLKEKEEAIAEKDSRNQDLTREAKHNQRESDDKVLDLETERDDLQRTLSEVSEHCDIFKTRAENMSNRFGSLSVSLSSMMEEQSALVKVIQQREEEESFNRKFRKQRAREMLEAEEVDSMNDNSDIEVTSAFSKQAKEMEAIAAVIAAVRT
mmetsp:Transcript_23522/g.25948  ORF Transcript_23522/g.25948 Transcript_23522/m.25948 type:complete len:481 (+) Transcript_23522:108-1550(+)